jgi:uncharacterized Zn finger protein
MARRRYDYYEDYYFKPTRPIEVEGGVKARSRRGAFAKNWWATRWIEAMERLMDPGRLRRGRSYARKGQVLSIEETIGPASRGLEGKGGVAARVQGSRRTPYKISIQVKPLSDAQWEKVIDALAGQALFAAQLLAGEMPQDIEQAFAAAGVSLFPDKRGDLVTACSCPDMANPCKHIAATHFILGERFDEDPFLLFRLRGRSQEQILQAMRQRRAGGEAAEEEAEEEPEDVTPLEATLPVFWQTGEPLASFPSHRALPSSPSRRPPVGRDAGPIGIPLSIKPPAVALPILKRLGEPAFVVGDTLQSQLAPAYQAITQAALAAAFGNGEEGEV